MHIGLVRQVILREPVLCSEFAQALAEGDARSVRILVEMLHLPMFDAACQSVQSALVGPCGDLPARLDVEQS